MQNVPLTVLSFFCLSLLYIFTFINSLMVSCKLKDFMPEARISKIFYISIMILCAVRCSCFGVSTFVFMKPIQG